MKNIKNQIYQNDWAKLHLDTNPSSDMYYINLSNCFLKLIEGIFHTWQNVFS